MEKSSRSGVPYPRVYAAMAGVDRDENAQMRLDRIRKLEAENDKLGRLVYGLRQTCGSLQVHCETLTRENTSLRELVSSLELRLQHIRVEHEEALEEKPEASKECDGTCPRAVDIVKQMQRCSGEKHALLLEKCALFELNWQNLLLISELERENREATSSVEFFKRECEQTSIQLRADTAATVANLIDFSKSKSRKLLEEHVVQHSTHDDPLSLKHISTLVQSVVDLEADAFAAVALKQDLNLERTEKQRIASQLAEAESQARFWKQQTASLAKYSEKMLKALQSETLRSLENCDRGRVSPI